MDKTIKDTDKECYKDFNVDRHDKTENSVAKNYNVDQLDKTETNVAENYTNKPWNTVLYFDSSTVFTFFPPPFLRCST